VKSGAVSNRSGRIEFKKGTGATGTMLIVIIWKLSDVHCTVHKVKREGGSEIKCKFALISTYQNNREILSQE